MKIKSLALTFALVAITSSVAFADSSFHANASVVVRDHRSVQDDCTQPVAAPLPVRTGTWYRPAPRPILVDNVDGARYVGPLGTVGYSNAMIAMSAPTRIENKREDFIVKQGGFDTIQLRGTHGATHITRVTVDFGDGIPAQIINVNRTLAAGQSFTLDVKGRNRTVNRIFVYGTSGRGSAYQLFAS
jgi:hypothetical protein